MIIVAFEKKYVFTVYKSIHNRLFKNILIELKINRHEEKSFIVSKNKYVVL